MYGLTKIVNDDNNEVPLESSLQAAKFVTAPATSAQRRMFKSVYQSYIAVCNNQLLNDVETSRTTFQPMDTGNLPAERIPPASSENLVPAVAKPQN